jgi:hypothetical protein
MKAKTALFAAILIIFTASSCIKAGNKYCWQTLDAFGNPVITVCDKSEAQMKASYPSPCNYYKLSDNQYCWLIDSNIFIKDKPEDYINHYLQCYNHTSAKKVPCDYCQTWYTRQKSTYKPNNTFRYSIVTMQRLCGDTVHTLFPGREIILRETADSLIVLQFSNDGKF